MVGDLCIDCIFVEYFRLIQRSYSSLLKIVPIGPVMTMLKENSNLIAINLLLVSSLYTVILRQVLIF